MSSSGNTTANTATAARVNTPYCKVCYDAGRPEKEYTSHYVKDQPGPNGKVICPTLLNQACRICGKSGHTSSYCPQYRQRRQEPRREERYIERDPRREERDDDRREPRREERYDDRREPRREKRYIEREPRREERYDDRREPRREERYDDRREPRREERREPPRRVSFNDLREDTERRDHEIRERDEIYKREQERRSKPWLQAALKPAQENQRGPYAHPHGPRTRLSLEENALCASKHATNDDETKQKPTQAAAGGAIDVRKVELNHAQNWGDEDNEQPFVCNPEQMTVAFLQECIMANLTTREEHDFIAACDNQSEMPFYCGQ